MPEKTVSIWATHADWSEDTLHHLTCPSYTEDGDSQGSEFSRAFGVSLDDDLLEVARVEVGCSLLAALEDFSYATSICDSLTEQGLGQTPQPFNQLVLAYDHRFTGTPSTASIRGVIVHYIASVSYRE